MSLKVSPDRINEMGTEAKALIGEIRDTARFVQQRLALSRSSLSRNWGSWFVVTPERLKIIDADLQEVSCLISHIQKLAGVEADEISTEHDVVPS